MPNATTTIVHPTVHLNGSSREYLAGVYATARRQMRQAVDDLYACAPNARDYYPQGDAAFARARAEHDARIARVLSVEAELADLCESVRAAGRL